MENRERSGNSVSLSGALIKTAVVGGLAFGALELAFGTAFIDQTTIGIVKSFGKPGAIIGPGLNFVWFWESVYRLPAGVVVSKDDTHKFRLNGGNYVTATIASHVEIVKPNVALDKQYDQIIRFYTDFGKGEDHNGTRISDPAQQTVDTIVNQAAAHVFSNKTVSTVADYSVLSKEIAAKATEDMDALGYGITFKATPVKDTHFEGGTETFANNIAEQTQKKQIIDLRAQNAVNEKDAQIKEAIALAAGATTRADEELKYVGEFATKNKMSFADALSAYQQVRGYTLLEQHRPDTLVIGTPSLPLSLNAGKVTSAPAAAPATPAQ